MEELNMYKTEYLEVYGIELYRQFYNSLNFFGLDSFAPNEHRMNVFETGLLIASRYNVILHSLTTIGSLTFFPLRSSPPSWYEHVAFTIGYVNDFVFKIVVIPMDNGRESNDYEQLPKVSPTATGSHSDVIVKIDNGDDRFIKEDDGRTRLLRNLSYEFWKNGNSSEKFNDLLTDSPVRGVINNECINASDHHHHHHRTSDSKQSVETDDLEDAKGGSSDDDEEAEVGSQAQQRQRRRTSNSGSSINIHDHNEFGGIGGEVLKCTSFQRRATLARTKTQQSRLMDPPPDIPMYSSPMPKSGGGYTPTVVGHVSSRIENDDEEDFLFDEDNPDDLKHTKLDAYTILQWISLVLIMTILIGTFRFSKWKQRTFRGLFIWQWEVLVLILICGRLVSGWVIRIVVFFIERNFLLRKRLLYFVYGVRAIVQNCIWLGLVLITWNSMFNKTVEERHIYFLELINKFLVCMFVATSLWLVKTLIVKVLASTFHVNKFFDRIQDALFNQYVIETLSGPPLVEIQNNQLVEKTMSRRVWRPDGVQGGSDVGTFSFKARTSGRVIGSGRVQTSRGVSTRHLGCSKHEGKDQALTIDHLHRMNPDNVSAWNMKRLMRIIRHGSLTTLDEQLHDTYDDETGTEIRSEIEAKRAARKIFMNVTRRRSKYIYLDDLMRFLREDEAVKTMSLLVGSPEDERVGKRALKNWVVNVFRERKALALTLNDTKTAVNKLHRMVNVLVGIAVLIICLVILNIATTKVIVLISSQIVVVTFVFGNTCKNIFESIIFLFVMHPFDVGDRCEIDGVQMIVEEMNILNTIFLRADNQKIYYPNSVLLQRSIGNFYRSPDMADAIDFLIHVSTPLDKIAIIKQRILNFVENNKDHWYPDPIVLTMDMQDLNTQKLSIWVQHKMNYQDITERLKRRGTIIEEMNRIFKELDIEYRTYPLDINIRSMPPATTNRVPSTWGPTN
ncbi:mechanosensitive ion channel protein 6-like [Cynara cardunculus var. scolymus]|uniref:mechanosensitive ion channel protein 6-like n=1 Tax=Cynara cardunculus var. scolymus TaxID=59895 RepID=UPI000D62AFB8|nr:mechanosensitive ion channel protein 6-like [Cynara cardunculus var. scolymus]